MEVISKDNNFDEDLNYETLIIAIFFFYLLCYAAMCLASLQGAVRSHQLTQDTDVGCGLPNAI